MIKIYTASTTGEIEKWVNEISKNKILEYDTLKVRCDSVDNSPSGVIYTATVVISEK